MQKAVMEDKETVMGDEGIATGDILIYIYHINDLYIIYDVYIYLKLKRQIQTDMGPCQH